MFFGRDETFILDRKVGSDRIFGNAQVHRGKSTIV